MESRPDLLEGFFIVNAQYGGPIESPNPDLRQTIGPFH